MTSLRDTLQNGLSTARHTACGPAVLHKSMARWRNGSRHLEEATHIVGKHAKHVMNLSAQTPQTHSAKSDPKPQHHSNPHKHC